MTSQLNEAKQETSIQLFELKDEITRLTEKNRELEGVFTGQPQFGDEPTDTYKCIQRIGRKGLQKITLFLNKMNCNILLKNYYLLLPLFVPHFSLSCSMLVVVFFSPIFYVKPGILVLIDWY